MSRLAGLIGRAFDVADAECLGAHNPTELAELIDAELRDDDDLMAQLADTAARSRRGPCARTNEADERLVLDLLDTLTSEAGS